MQGLWAQPILPCGAKVASREQRVLYFLLGMMTFVMFGFVVQWFDETIVKNVKTSVSDPFPVQIISAGP